MVRQSGLAAGRSGAHDRMTRQTRKMALGWDGLAHWGDDARRIRPLSGGSNNDVWRVDLGKHSAVARLGTRSDADLAWEADLLLHLDRQGLAVPVPIPTTDGRLFADGLMVMTYMEGRPPRTGGRLAPRRRNPAPPAPGDPRLAATPRLAILDRPFARNNRNPDRPCRDARRSGHPLPVRLGAAGRTGDVALSMAIPTIPPMSG